MNDEMVVDENAVVDAT